MGERVEENKDSLSILVGDGFPSDQHYMQNPNELFTKPNCELQVDLNNMLVLEGHIQCAAYEMPIRPVEDAHYFTPDLAKLSEGTPSQRRARLLSLPREVSADAGQIRGYSGH